MDGTLFHFPLREFKAKPEILKRKGFFRNLAPHMSLIVAARMLNKLDDVSVVILSAYPLECEYARSEKEAAINEYLPEIKRRIFIPCGASKREASGCMSENDILIDDYQSNLDEWHGIPVKFINEYNSVKKGLPYVTHYAEPEEISSTLYSLSTKYELQKGGGS